MCVSVRVSCGRSVQLSHLHVLLVILATEIGPKHSPRPNMPVKFGKAIWLLEISAFFENIGSSVISSS